MSTVLYEEDGWLVEPLDTPTQESTQHAETITRHCGRCRKDQPIENFTRSVSRRQALYLARKEGLAETTEEYYSRAAIHQAVMMAHKLCNACAAKLRKEKRETADEYDTRLRMLKRYERHTYNPYYISPLKTPHEPLTITEREVMVRKYKEAQNARKVDGRRRADKERKSKVYAAQMKEVRNEIQRIGVRMRATKASEDYALSNFLDKYRNHLFCLRDSIRDLRYSFNPPEPLESTFKYVRMENINTQIALKALRDVEIHEVDKIAPRFLPTADFYREKTESDLAYIRSKQGCLD